ncbi:hypothetical protein C8A01DRAFT_41762 [Parachaetomium inaequale]|uniref:Aminoglycoside phosphotransferase domain-containing protein n=1 Tax=Parachaetomium inaequale TaxID=2588326 RepID=A0AAN6P8M4_9PEZI|nr:hypothetical protein C8A01DRAFT_41762 [Parachaetomium inaequale]
MTTRPVVFRYAPSQFDLDALLLLASRLRQQPCSCNKSKPPLAGSLNWAIFVSFDDGVEWAFRSPDSGRRAFLSDEYTSRILASEVATLEYVKRHSSIPVPEVFAYSASGDNDIGVPYILMSKAHGRPLSTYGWLPPAHQPLAEGTTLLSEWDKRKILSQLGAITAQLSQLRFDKIGSLSHDSAGNFTIGECLSPWLTWQQRDLLANIDRGPYDDETAYLESLMSVYIAHAKELPMTPHAFFAPIPDPAEYPSWASFRAAASRWNNFVAVGQKIDHSRNRLAYCIAGQIMRKMIPRLRSDAPADEDGGGGFPLGHPDLHLGNIFVDDALNVTWLLHTRDSSTENPLVAAFRAVFERAASGGEPAVGPGTWQRAAMMQHLQRLIRMLSTRDYHDFAALYALAHPGQGGGKDDDGESAARDVLPALFSERARRDENKKLLGELGEDDWPRDEVERQERASFVRPSSPATQEKLAVARKLTLLAEMNERLVADRRLWRWIEDAMEDVGDVARV